MGGGNYFIEYLKNTNCYIIWDKRGNLPEVPFMDMEFAWTNFTKKAKKYICINHGFIKDDKAKIEHPTQKPLKLFFDILKDFSKEDNLILDCFAGSGVTGVASLRLNRKCILIEKEKKYCDIIVRRLGLRKFL